MSAVLSPSNSFSARLTLAAGVLVIIEAPSMSALGDIVGKLQPAANDSGAQPAGKSAKGAATAPAGSPASTTTASSATTAAVQGAGEAGKDASTSAQGTAQPAASGSAATGDAGNGAAAAGQAATAASSSSPAASPDVSFEVLKKAFLALSTNTSGGTDGRSKCQGVLAPFTLAKLSDAKPEQYAALLDAINKAAK